MRRWLRTCEVNVIGASWLQDIKTNDIVKPCVPVILNLKTAYHHYQNKIKRK